MMFRREKMSGSKQCNPNNKNLPLFDSSGVYITEKQELSPPEGRSYVVTGNNKPRERGWWTSRPRSGAPGWAADKRGHYRDQHQPEESDPDLLMEEGHDNSTQTVVKLREVVFQQQFN